MMSVFDHQAAKKKVWDKSVNSSCGTVLPEEERQPADHEGAHYDAEGACSLVFRPPAGSLLPHRRACNQRHTSTLHIGTENMEHRMIR